MYVCFQEAEVYENSVSNDEIEVRLVFRHHPFSATGLGARGSSLVRVFAHGAMGRRIDPSRWTN